jgi:hypothetical protein
VAKSKNSGSRGRTPFKPNELRRSQLRVLCVLWTKGATSARGITSGLTLDEIAQHAKVSVGFVRQGLGAPEPERRAERDKVWGYKSLLTRGLVRVDDDGLRGYVYSTTALGERYVEDHQEDVLAAGKTRPNVSGHETTRTEIVRTKRRPKFAG